jgi:hypothetical protein
MCVVGWHGLRGMGPAPASKLGGGSAFALRARGRVIASNAGFGLIPLRSGDVEKGWFKAPNPKFCPPLRSWTRVPDAHQSSWQPLQKLAIFFLKIDSKNPN